MARHTEAVCRLCRREGIKLFLKGQRCLSDKCAVERRSYPPGEHGRRRHKPTEYSVQLREKQRAKRIYGVFERQFHNYYKLAARQRGVTGETLLRLLESRLDNVVYRAGFASSRAQARQIVRHRHVEVNGRRVNIPSYRVREGEIVTVAAKSREHGDLKLVLEQKVSGEPPVWLSVDRKNLMAKVAHLPERSEIDLSIQEKLIVELYSK